MLPPWAAEYVGIPFAEHGRDRCGCDCWGLVRLVLAERFGVEVSDFEAYRDSRDGAAIEARIRAEQERWAAVSEPSPGDVVVLRIAGRPHHLGVVIAPSVMLHVERGIDSCIESYDGPLWRNRIDGFWRRG
ncbi:MAG: C40 family peptidase [Desulfuromonadales bacterium]|nr:C40 family peptidase [Desulfuromonadales bacterium]